MYDCTLEKSFLNVREWIDTIHDSSDKRVPIIIIGNKTDLRDTTTNRRTIQHEEGKRLASEYAALFVETSAKDGQNIEESLIEICRLDSFFFL
jgi:GTPase SAR1 family protein